MYSILTVLGVAICGIAVLASMALVALFIALFLAPFAWLLMVILGALAHIFGASWLAIGFLPSYLITVLLGIFL